MGGKNHQPCNIYLERSTQLSRCLSVAYAEVELGNVALEDVILAELRGDTASVQPIKSHLRSSRTALREAFSVADALRDQMDQNDFVDLPSLWNTDLDVIGNTFTAKKMVNEEAWLKITAIMETGGFYAVLARFMEGIRELTQKTSILFLQVEGLEEVASRGGVHHVLEENHEGNIKEAFASLYTAWNSYSQDFLASSLLSTELWYMACNYGSLADHETQTLAVS